MFFQFVLIYLFFTIAGTIGFTSSTIIAGLSGYLFGWQSGPYVLITYSGSILIGYYIGAKIGSPLIDLIKKKKPSITKIIRHVTQGNLMNVVMIRLSPILPFAMMNYLLGAYKTNLRFYFWGSILGMIPRSALALFIGIQANSILESINSTNQPIWTQITITLLILLTLTYFVFKIFKKRT